MRKLSNRDPGWWSAGPPVDPKMDDGSEHSFPCHTGDIPVIGTQLSVISQDGGEESSSSELKKRVYIIPIRVS